MSALLDLLKKIPLKKIGPAGGVLLAIITVGIIGYRMRWWQRLVVALGWGFWLGLILVVVLAIVVFLLWWLPRYREKRFLQRLQSEDEKTPRDDVKAHRRRLQEKMLEAIRTLQSSPELRQKEGMPLYALPWYLLLGDTQSGKTTLLQTVAKDLRTVAHTSARVEGPTQDCDWWFFNTAIILDVAGAYAFPGEVEREGAQWYHFLELLRHYRGRQPINGLMIAVAADTIGLASEDELRREADELRNRVNEIIDQLGVNFPVYVLVTRCDLIEGFTEFFDAVPERTLNQVLGYVHEAPLNTVKQQPDAEAERPFASVFTSLVDRLQQLRLWVFNEETVPPSELHQKIFCFPEEFRAFQQPLGTFMDRLFRYDRFLHSPMFRGIFFCSAVQQGAPFSFLRRELHMNGRSSTLGATSSKPYFLQDLFTLVLPRDQYLVSPTKKAVRGRRFKHLFGLSVCVGLCVVSLLLLTQAYVSDRQVERSVVKADCEAATALAQAEVPLEKVNLCRQEVQALRDRNRRRLPWAKVVFNRSGKLEREMRQRYTSLFETEVLTRLDARLAQHLSAESETIPLVFLLIKRIELIDLCRSASGCPDPLAPEVQPDYALMLDPSQQQSPDPNRVEWLQKSYEAYLRWSADSIEVLERQRQAHADRLQDWFVANQFAPSQILSWANQNYKPVTLHDYWEGLPSGDSKKLPQVEAAYTPDAWKQSIRLFLQRAGDAVPSMKADLKNFQEDYRRQYFDQWQRFLAAFPSGEHPWQKTYERRRQLALQLLDANSPYNRILDDAVQQLEPFLPAKVKVASAEVAAKIPKGLTVPKIPPADPEAHLPPWLRVLRRYVDSDSRKAYMASLQRLAPELAKNAPMQKSFQLVQAAFQEGMPTEKSTHPVLKAWWIVKQFQDQEDPGGTTTAPFWPLLERPVRFVWKTILENAGRFLQQSWVDNVVDPIAGLSQMEQIKSLYGPQGKVREFVDQFARPFLVENESRLGQVLGEGIPLSPEFLDTVRTERLLKQSLTPGASLWVRVEASQPSDIDSPINLIEEKTEFRLDCANKTHTVTNQAESFTQSSAMIFWSFETCGDVTITIVMSCDRVCVERAALVGMSVPETSGLRVSKRYTGQMGFLHFIEDFRAAEHPFRLQDFADSYPQSLWQKLQATLRTYNIRAILVYFRVEVSPALKILQDALAAESMVAPQIVRSIWP